MVNAGSYADVALNRILKKFNFNQRDKSFLTEISYGAIRRKIQLDKWIDYLGKIPSKKQPPLLRLLLHIGLYQLLEMDRIPSFAAINTTVEIAKHSQLKKLAPMVNGFLRNVNRCIVEGKSIPKSDDFIDCFSFNYSLPKWISKDLISWYGINKAEEIGLALINNPSFDLRVNSLKVNRSKVKSQFKEIGVKVSDIETCLHGISLDAGYGSIKDLPGYKEGLWCVQDRSSQWVANLLSPREGEKILDACAAPGVKTTYIAELMGDKGEIWAVDRSSERLNMIKNNTQRLCINSVNITVGDSTELHKTSPRWINYFQKILVDAPCSGLGTLSRNPDARWRITKSNINKLIDLQKKILDSTSQLLKVKGKIIYSTCTLNPNENIVQIQKFLERHNNFRLVSQNQILPDMKNGDGFFGAVLERVM